MTIDSVQYNALTKNGNPYNKTNANRKAGAIISATTAAGLLGLTAYNFKKDLNNGGKNIKEAINVSLPNGKEFDKYRKIINEAIENKQIGKIFKKIPASTVGVFLVIAAFLAIPTSLGISIGTINDCIVNKIRANKADKEAELYS